MRSILCSALLLFAHVEAAVLSRELLVEVSGDGFTVSFPQDWKVGSGWGEHGLYAVSPNEHRDDLFHANVNVLVDRDTGSGDLDEYYQLSLKGLKMLATDFDLQESGSATIDGEPARYLVFTHRAGNYTLKVLQYMTMSHHRAYIITCTATVNSFAEYEPEFKKIIDSFRFQSGNER